MCGIVGCILKDSEKSVAPILLECVENLDYRGYDSVGIATVDGKIHEKRTRERSLKWMKSLIWQICLETLESLM